MLCEECHNNEANFTVSIVSGEELTTRHLCADCMSRMNADLMKGNLRSFLTTMLGALQAGQKKEEKKEFSMPIFGRFTQMAQQILQMSQRIAADLQMSYVGTEHLLLAMLKLGASVPQAVSSRMNFDSAVAEIREHLQEEDRNGAGEKGRVELSPRAKKLLETSVMESRKLGQNYVSAEHIWLAMLGSDDGVAGALLRKNGVDLSAAREELLQQMRDSASSSGQAAGQQPVPGFMPFAAQFRVGQGGGNQGEQKSALDQFCRDLTAAAEKNELDPVIGRENEIQRIIQILIRRTKNNPVLIG
ncbi:MAG: hypothetical protein II888_00420, partial [Clostridia bacterium]|nr:hypothetical protein [Clostridia bacterium]